MVGGGHKLVFPSKQRFDSSFQRRKVASRMFFRKFAVVKGLRDAARIVVWRAIERVIFEGPTVRDDCGRFFVGRCVWRRKHSLEAAVVGQQGEIRDGQLRGVFFGCVTRSRGESSHACACYPQIQCKFLGVAVYGCFLDPFPTPLSGREIQQKFSITTFVILFIAW